MVSPIQAVGAIWVNYDEVPYYNGLPVYSPLGIHGLALEKKQNVSACFDPKYSLKNCELENVVR